MRPPAVRICSSRKSGGPAPGTVPAGAALGGLRGAQRQGRGRSTCMRRAPPSQNSGCSRDGLADEGGFLPSLRRPGTPWWPPCTRHAVSAAPRPCPSGVNAGAAQAPSKSQTLVKMNPPRQTGLSRVGCSRSFLNSGWFGIRESRACACVGPSGVWGVRIVRRDQEAGTGAPASAAVAMVALRPRGAYSRGQPPSVADPQLPPRPQRLPHGLRGTPGARGA